MAVTASNLIWPEEKKVEGTLAFDSSYPTGGETITPAQFGLALFNRIEINPTGAAAGGAGFGYFVTIAADQLSAKVLVFETSGGTPAGTNSTSAVTGTGTGTAAAQTFTGTAPTAALNIGTPAFSGTGQSSSGQVITTTDTQTMIVNQCAGMWFVSATHGPYLIASNTAVTGAVAVLTIVGTAPTTDAGAYQILKAVTPAGTNGTSAVTVSSLSATAAAQTFTGTAASAGAFVQIANATSLASLTAVPVTVYGY